MLNPGQSLDTNQSMYSCDGRFFVVMQSDNNLVLYWSNGAGALWSSNTVGTGANLAAMQTDGNFVLYGPSGAVWATNTSSPGAYLAVQNDGNLVIYPGAIWASNTGGH